jgi:hypothetical protein
MAIMAILNKILITCPSNKAKEMWCHYSEPNLSKLRFAIIILGYNLKFFAASRGSGQEFTDYLSKFHNFPAVHGGVDITEPNGLQPKIG